MIKFDYQNKYKMKLAKTLEKDPRNSNRQWVIGYDAEKQANIKIGWIDHETKQASYYGSSKTCHKKIVKGIADSKKYKMLTSKAAA